MKKMHKSIFERKFQEFKEKEEECRKNIIEQEEIEIEIEQEALRSILEKK